MDNKDLEYFIHYIKHTHYVVLAWKAMCEVLWNRDMLTEEEFEKTTKLITWHDQSKMNISEWGPYRDKFYGDKNNADVKKDFKVAKEEHKTKNLHHFESLKNYKGKDWKCYVVELVCDYIAMGWEFNNYVLEYYAIEREKIDLPKEYKTYLESILDILREPEFYEIVERPLTKEKIAELDFKDITLGYKK